MTGTPWCPGSGLQVDPGLAGDRAACPACGRSIATSMLTGKVNRHYHPNQRAAVLAARRRTSQRGARSRHRTDAQRGTSSPTSRQLDYLNTLARMGRHATIGALADAMRVNDRSARTVLARLEHAGWVEVMRLRRPAWVRLAPAGEVLLLTRSAAAFTAAMAAQGIHVGIGSPPLCAVCDVPYPCAEVRPDTLACDSDGQQATTVSTVTGTTDG